MGTKLMKISLRLYGKLWHELTSEQRSNVMNIYYDFY
jgi:hypothetical protein